MFYKVLLKDRDGYVIGAEHEEQGMRNAKEKAKYLLSDEYARVTESENCIDPEDKVEVFNEAGELVYDRQRD